MYPNKVFDYMAAKKPIIIGIDGAARILAKRGTDNIVLVLHGDGGRRPELEKKASDYKLRNLIFSDLVPDKSEVARLVASCDASMTIYRAAQECTWSPNKMFDALAAGKPILSNVPGWLGELIQGNKCGRCLDPHCPETLTEALEELASDPDLCREMGRNARVLAERDFDRVKLTAKLESVLLKVIEES